MLRKIRKKIRRFNTNLGNFCMLIATDIILSMISWAATSIICTNFPGAGSILRIPVGALLFLILSTAVWAYMGEVFYDRLTGHSVIWKILFFISLGLTVYFMACTQYNTALLLIDGVSAPLSECLKNPSLKANYVGLVLLFFPVYTIGMTIGFILGNHTPLIDDLDDDEVMNGQSGITP